jgi:dolichyl-phosphate beta-glucosyltransferase
VADADGSGDISCIDSMLYCMEEMFSTLETARLAIPADQYPFDQPPAVVVGSRQYLGRKSPLRALLSWGFRTCVSIIFFGSDLGISDTQCGFKLMTNSAGKVLYNKLNLRRWTQDVEVIHRARVIGIPVRQCDVPWIDKEGSKLVSNTSDAIFVSLMMLSEIANMRLRYAFGVWKVPLHNADYER